MRTRIFRWKAIIPLGVILAAVWIVSYLFLDPTVERSVEAIGTAVVGARVDLEEADVRLTEGVVYLRGLAVTNPDRPMTNLFEADEIVANFRVPPLLEKKIVIDTVALRGLRFGTARATSGALERPSETSREIRQEVGSWRESLPLPEFSLAGLGQAVDVGAVQAESLATLRAARDLVTQTDASRQSLEAEFAALDPRPPVDSARALAQRLEGASLRTLGIGGTRDAVTLVRNTLTQLTQLDDAVSRVERAISAEVGRARRGLDGVLASRRNDYAYALGLLQLPSLTGPSLGPALFGSAVTAQVAPYLYWLGVADRYMPPGVRARLHEGKDRARRSGTTVVFPRHEDLPTFLLEFAEATVAIGGGGAGAGDYEARLVDLTSEPALLGRPATFALVRTEGIVGPQTIRVTGMLNHVGSPVRDSAAVLLDGVRLPELALPSVGARLVPGAGATEIALTRVGDSLDARWRWTASAVAFERAEQVSDGDAASDLLWRVLSRVRNLELVTRLSGPVTSPRLSVQSNVADALAAGLRDELGAEVARAEAQVRARVDALVAEDVGRARGAVNSLESDATARVDGVRADIARAREELEARLRSLTGGLPIG